MSYTLSPAIRLNNEAANLLQAGSTMEAVYCFQGALITMKLSVMDNHNHPGMIVDWAD
jgi:hypothetical protein